MKRLKVIVEKHSDGHVVYSPGMKGVVVGEDDTYEDALADVESAIRFHIETFGSHESFEQKSCTEMSGDTVIELLQLFDQYGIEVVVDGGWGVDALLGRQTRSHGDLDIALQHNDVSKLRALLEARGYKDVPRDDTRDCNFVMGDDKGHEVDLHSYTFDAHGKLVFGVEYPLDSLTGIGSIHGYSVKCISPEWMVKFHSGYELDENDYHDVTALCKHFGFDLPGEYGKFT